MRITAPTEFRIEAPGVTQVEAKADFGGQAIERVEFAVDGEVKFTDDTEPCVFEWQNRRVGKFVITTTAQGADTLHIASEHTEFQFTADHDVWAVTSAQGLYSKIKLSESRHNLERP